MKKLKLKTGQKRFCGVGEEIHVANGKVFRVLKPGYKYAKGGKIIKVSGMKKKTKKKTGARKTKKTRK